MAARVSGDALGPYRIVRAIGSGGMGAVYEAAHSVLGKRVALKTWITGDVADAELAQRFVGEGQAASRLRHPNVVDVTDIGVHAGTPYLVMELLEGETLADLIARGPATPVDALDALLPIIDALTAAHAAGIIHRDLKPQNVFLVASRGGVVVPKLLDFGISRMTRPGVEALTQGAGLLGTPSYMAPSRFAMPVASTRVAMSSRWGSYCTRCSPVSALCEAKVCSRSSMRSRSAICRRSRASVRIFQPHSSKSCLVRTRCGPKNVGPR